MLHNLPGNYNRDLIIIFKCRLADLEVVTVDSSLNSWTWIKTDIILNENVSHPAFNVWQREWRGWWEVTGEFLALRLFMGSNKKAARLLFYDVPTSRLAALIRPGGGIVKII